MYIHFDVISKRVKVNIKLIFFYFGIMLCFNKDYVNIEKKLKKIAAPYCALKKTAYICTPKREKRKRS